MEVEAVMVVAVEEEPVVAVAARHLDGERDRERDRSRGLCRSRGDEPKEEPKSLRSLWEYVLLSERASSSSLHTLAKGYT